MRRLTYILLFITIISGCRTESFIRSERISQVKNYNPGAFVYYLPATKIIVEVEAVKVVENKGIYADYAKEFLGNLGNIITENRTYWELSNIKISSVPVRDTNNIWTFTSSEPQHYSFQLTPEGFPVALGKNIEFKHWQTGTQSYLWQNRRTDSSETLLVIDQGYKEVYDTIFKIEKYDTIQRTVPIIERRFIKKSTREQARELADKIFLLRDDREALLVGEGDSEYLPDGEALKIMLKGLDKLEKEYLAQFIGRTDKTIFHYRFEIIPEHTNDIIQQVLFRFSPEKGILPPSALKGEPVIFEMKSSFSTKPIANFNQNQRILRRVDNVKDNRRGLAYRIPEKVTVQVKKNNKILAEKQMLVSQFGTISFLPVKLFESKKLKIEFYPEYGSIKSIETE